MTGINFGGSGWVRAYGQDNDEVPLPGRLYLRFAPGPGGRQRVVELYLDATDADPLTAEDLRHLRLVEVEATVNAMPDLLRTGRRGPDLSGTMRRHFKSHGYISSRVGDGPIPRPQMHRPRSDDTDYRLTDGPGADGLSDDFLRRVAKAYYAAIARGERPTRTLVEDTGGDPTRTSDRRRVESWVYKARRRGVMPRGRRGTAG